MQNARPKVDRGFTRTKEFYAKAAVARLRPAQTGNVSRDNAPKVSIGLNNRNLIGDAGNTVTYRQHSSVIGAVSEGFLFQLCRRVETRQQSCLCQT